MSDRGTRSGISFFHSGVVKGKVDNCTYQKDYKPQRSAAMEVE